MSITLLTALVEPVTPKGVAGHRIKYSSQDQCRLTRVHKEKAHQSTHPTV